MAFSWFSRKQITHYVSDLDRLIKQLSKQPLTPSQRAEQSKYKHIFDQRGCPLSGYRQAQIDDH